MVSAFVQATAGAWGRPRPELQDEGTFVLLSVEVPVSDTRPVPSAMREAIARALNQIAPPNAAQPLGTWMVNFVRNGQVYESIFHDGA
jgi:hypothetical protein